MGTNHREYTGIREATREVTTNQSYPGPREILPEPLSLEEIETWTDSLTGFEADAIVTQEDETILRAIEELYQRSLPALREYANEIGVRELNEFAPESVLFMVCIRDLQQQVVGKSNLNPHKLSVLRGGRFATQSN